MTRPTTLPFGDFLIQVETSPGSGTFTKPCGFTTKDADETLSTQDTIVPDCDDPDAVAFVERDGDSLSMTINASGVLAMEDSGWPLWRVWLRSGTSRLVRLYHDKTLSNNGGYDEGSFLVTNIKRTGTRGSKVMVDVTLASDGAYEWEPASA